MSCAPPPPISGYLEGYLAMTGDARRASSLPQPDDDLARFAGKVGAIAESIEGRL
jgi:hypothetical protein